MIKKKYILILLLTIVLGTVSAVSASEMSQTDCDNNIIESPQDIEEISVQKEETLQTADNTQEEISAQEEDSLQIADNTPEEILTIDESKSVVGDDSSPKHVNFAASDKTVTYGKLQHIRVKVTDDNGNPLKDVTVRFKIYKNNKLVAKQDEYSTGKDGYVYYCTKDLNAGKYKVTYEIVDKNTYTATKVTSKLTVKQIKLTAKIKRSTGEIDIFLKKNKKPINKIKLKVKVYTGKKYKTIYLKSGYNKKISKYKGFCAFATNALKVGKHKVVITSANKNYKLSKTTSFKITKAIKKYESILILVSGGKLYYYSGF
jgi:5-hydroxyisourate hydrolase-like protein (transthyretin family)